MLTHKVDSLKGPTKKQDENPMSWAISFLSVKGLLYSWLNFFEELFFFSLNLYLSRPGDGGGLPLSIQQLADKAAPHQPGIGEDAYADGAKGGDQPFYLYAPPHIH